MAELQQPGRELRRHLNNQQLTQDPRTGIFYDAPYDSYDAGGASGPGYYKDDQKLDIINRQ